MGLLKYKNVEREDMTGWVSGGCGSETAKKLHAKYAAHK